MALAHGEKTSKMQRMRFRFGATVFANLIRAAMSFFSGLVIAKGLGASGYGDLNFLLGTFVAVSQLLEMGTSSAFYTFISNKPQQAVFFVMYFTWLAFQFCSTVIILIILLPSQVIQWVWIGHTPVIILLSFAASFLMTQVWGTVVQLGEAARETLLVQAIGIAQAAAHLILILAALRLEWFSVQSILWLLLGEHLCLVVMFGPRLLRKNVAVESQSGRSKRPISVLEDYALYCRPLAIYAWMGFVYTFADRWLLQWFGGSQQQGFFAIGQQFANVTLIGATSMLKVFWKEVAEARQREDHERVRHLYISVSRGLFYVSAWMSCLFIPYGREILRFTVGSGYEYAWPVLALLFLYAIYQSLGQIGGTFFYASGETGDYARIGMAMMAISFPVTYFLLAPSSSVVPGLGLGAAGLALRLIVQAVIDVNLKIFRITKKNGWVFDYWYQVVVIGAFLGLGIMCKWVSSASIWLAGLIPGPIGVMILGGCLYSFLTLLFFYYAPELSGLRREHIDKAVAACCGWGKGKYGVTG